MHVTVGWLERIVAAGLTSAIIWFRGRVRARAGLGRCDRVPGSMMEALGGLLLLMHHQLDHIVLVHELLALADSIFAL